ncbi:MAG: alkaline phosphatase family protein [Aeromicrobium sp.]
MASHRATGRPDGGDDRTTRSPRRVIVIAGTLVVLTAAAAFGYAAWSDSAPTELPEAAPTSSSAPVPSPTPDDTPSSEERAAEPSTPIVLAISVDGLNPESITRLGATGTPTLHRLIDEGASTLNARTAHEQTITLPNHTGMLTGRMIGGDGGHGVTFNDDNGKTLESTHGDYVPGVFDVAHDNGLQTAFLAEKDKFGFLMRTWDATHGAPDTTGEDDGRDKTDLDVVADDAQVVAAAREAITDGSTDLVFLHLAAPDQAGHANGWLGTAYLEAVRSVDRDLGQIVSTIEAEPGLRDRVTILLTADHGGKEGLTRHDDMTSPANYTIPFITWGRGVTPDTDLYALNPGRADPEALRPGYDGAQPVRNIDIANTALSLLGLPDIAGAVASTWPALDLR